ncbi:UPF0280 family protein [Chloroflexota bacterium]
MYEPRTYRHWVKGKDLTNFNIIVKETDLYIRASTDLSSKAYKLVVKFRNALEQYIKRHPDFASSHTPLLADKDAPIIVRKMSESAAKAGVGPMAGVAGAIAEMVGVGLLKFSPEVIVENGGDIYLKSLERRWVGIYAGKSPLTGKIALEIEGKDTPLGICTSSGTVGHSLSYGQADAVMVISKSATLADVAATAIGNLIIESGDIPRGINFAERLDGVCGVVIIKDDEVGFWGNIKVCRMIM